MPTNINLPANLPENWQTGQIVSPSGTEVGLSKQHGYNYLMQQVNDTQEAANALSQAVDAQEESQAQLETDVEDLQTDMTQAKSDVESLQTDVGNLQTGQGQLATPNATATHSGSVVVITAPAGVNLISFYAPSDFSGDDTYTVNGSAVTLTDLNGNAIYDGWKEGAPVQLILKGAQAFFKAGGGVNDTLPPLNPNMTGELADGVFTVTADKLPVAQADALAGAEWYYGDHVPARPGDGTKVEFTREQLITSAPEGKAASEYYTGDIVKIKENGVPQEFYVAKHDYPTDGNGRTLLVRRYIYDMRQWHTSNVNAYASCVLDGWFENTYHTLFSESVRAMIEPVDIPYTPGNGNNSVTTLSRRVFALSVTELGKTASYANVEGSALPIASTLQIAYNSSGSAVVQWTRSPYADTISGAYCLYANGNVYNNSCTNTYGARPAFTIPSTALFDPDTNELIEDATSGISTLAATTNLGDETEGSIVTLLESGAPTQFYVSKQNYQNDINGNGRVLLVRKDVYDLRAWAADNITTYADSDIDAWFNGEYKSKFSPYIQDKMGSTKFYYTIGNGNNSVVQLKRSVFALSLTEFGITSEYANVEGVSLPNAEDLRIAYLTGNPQLQWTRTPAISNITNVFRLSRSGAESNANPNNSSGSRPCFTLPADMQVNADGSIVESDNSPVVTLSIPWTESGYCYCRQFPYNAKHQYQTQLVGAVATNDPDYGSGEPALPEFEYTGTYQLIDDGDGNWRIKFTTSGTLTMAKTTTVDLFLVGGGGGGVSGGGGGGYTVTHTSVVLEGGTPYTVTIGGGGTGGAGGMAGNGSAGGATSIGSYSITGGASANQDDGGNGGSGGGGSGSESDNWRSGGNGGSDGANGATSSHPGGTGQGTTTREFGETDGELYSGGGGGLSGDSRSGGNGGAGGPNETIALGGSSSRGKDGQTPGDGIGGTGGIGQLSVGSRERDYYGGGGGAGYGGGGGGSYAGGSSAYRGGNGFQGIAIIRNHREAAS